MKNRIKPALLIYLIFLSIIFIFTPYSYSRMPMGRNSEFIAAVTLLYPTTDNVVLTGKDYLEFRWERINTANIDHYDFRLYKGYNTTAEGLILKQKFPSNTYPVKIPVSQFEEGQAYSWSLMQVLYGGAKSDRSFASFKIIKK
ncbi:MAG: hypothetical protein PHC54_06590 [Candidatus Omnitrophica bacterium]|nr:hypothetical protein [Candidatus Omnitrophota bacterium]MDD5592813.1 hypothetical protein [Candidatus Omnitrophota bacterium]